ncbi:tRNA1(Val) (adenine(37)-N6)-methyltransferase [Helicobacter suis]|uniref:tRNA1(Val) (adenine(37)-N6)-methyltransferase n=1 Tax=Helicobacter suis TaxID=104628 RepID=UPI0035A21F28
MVYLRFYQPLKGYAYNSTSLFLVNFALPFIKKGDRLLDVGAGCGIVGILCAKKYANPLDLIEIDSNLAFFARLNSQNLPQAQVYQANFLDYPLTPGYDAILSNPPYYPAESLKSPYTQKARATNQSFLPLLDFCTKASFLLKPKGYFILCYHASLIDTLISALQKAKLKAILLRFVHPFKDQKASLILCCARKNSKSLVQISPPLITHKAKDQRAITEEVASIYARFKTHSIKASLEMCAL